MLLNTQFILFILKKNIYHLILIIGLIISFLLTPLVITNQIGEIQLIQKGNYNQTFVKSNNNWFLIDDINNKVVNGKLLFKNTEQIQYIQIAIFMVVFMYVFILFGIFDKHSFYTLWAKDNMHRGELINLSNNSEQVYVIDGRIVTLPGYSNIGYLPLVYNQGIIRSETINDILK